MLKLHVVGDESSASRLDGGREVKTVGNFEREAGSGPDLGGPFTDRGRQWEHSDLFAFEKPLIIGNQRGIAR